MPKNDDGEFELVLGNRQLLTVFFIVVLLLGVFFTMGYIVGLNSAPEKVDVAAARKPESKPLVVDSAQPPQSQTATSQPAPSPSAPEASTPPAETPAPATQAAPAPPQEKARPTQAPLKSPAVAKSTPPVTNEPAAGQLYLQLVATGKTEADAMVDVLRKNGFKSIDAEVPEKPGLFRVLIGPIVESDVNRTKADLQAKGFPGDHAIRKTF